MLWCGRVCLFWLLSILAVGGCHRVAWVPRHPDRVPGRVCCCFFSSPCTVPMGTNPWEGVTGAHPQPHPLGGWETSKCLEALLRPLHWICQHHHPPVVIRPTLVGELCPGNQPAPFALLFPLGQQSTTVNPPPRVPLLFVTTLPCNKNN